jgi:hypothetical protein
MCVFWQKMWFLLYTFYFACLLPSSGAWCCCFELKSRSVGFVHREFKGLLVDGTEKKFFDWPGYRSVTFCKTPS